MINKSRLIEGFIDLDKQLTPNGIDLTVEKVFKFCSAGRIDFSNADRHLPDVEEIPAQKENPQDKFGWRRLSMGAYKVRTNEVVNMPDNLTGLGFSRTSLLRMGAWTQNGVWDAGFSGKSEFILAVENPWGISLKENARVMHLVFFAVDKTAGYQGIYNHLK